MAISGPGFVRGMPGPAQTGFVNPAASPAQTPGKRARSIPGFALGGVPGPGEVVNGGTVGGDGFATLVAGHATVAAAVKTGETVKLSRHKAGGTPGTLSTSSITNGSFHIDSTSETDTSVVKWQVIPGAR